MYDLFLEPESYALAATREPGIFQPECPYGMIVPGGAKMSLCVIKRLPLSALRLLERLREKGTALKDLRVAD